jgi:GMP synthase (glutamine-hydrolysing)
VPQRPFLLLQSRADDHLAAQEHDAVVRLGGLAPHDVVTVRMERGPFTPLDLRGFAGVLVGGSPYTSSDPPEVKHAEQRRVEAELSAVIRQVVAEGVPFLGLCYGIGAAALALGGVVDRTYAEPVGPATVCLTEAGRADPVFGGLPDAFTAFVGHKEACSVMPADAVLLATSAACPVQAYRVGARGYVTQFHPELELDSLVWRIRAYAHHGYFEPDEMDDLIASVQHVDASGAHEVLRAFVRAFG